MPEWVLIPLGFAVGAYGTLVGAGGGFVLVPVLLLLYPGARPATITSISLAVVCCNALAGSLAYARARRIDYRTAFSFAAAAIPGAVLGAITVSFVPRNVFSGLFGILLLGLAAVIMFRPQPQAGTEALAHPGLTKRVLVDASGAHYEYAFRQRRGVLMSVVIGFLSSLLGIGGGIIHVPTMVLLLGFPTHIATATSQLILAVMTGAGTGVHLATGELAFGSGLRRALLLSAGAIPGALVGARISRSVHGTGIIRLLALALVLIGVQLLASAFAPE